MPGFTLSWLFGCFGQFSGLLVLGEHGDAAGVPLLAAERRGHELLDEAGGLLDRVHARAEADDVGVVVLPGELRGLVAPDDGGARPAHLVGGDDLAVP